MLHALVVYTQLRRVPKRIVDANLLYETPISGAAAVSGYETVKWSFFPAGTGESKSYGHEVL